MNSKTTNLNGDEVGLTIARSQVLEKLVSALGGVLNGFSQFFSRPPMFSQVTVGTSTTVSLEVLEVLPSIVKPESRGLQHERRPLSFQ